MPAAASGEAARRRRRRSSSGSRASSSGRSSSSVGDAAMLSPPPLSLGEVPLQPLDFDDLEPLPPSRLDVSAATGGFSLGSRSNATLSPAEVSPQWSAAGSATGSPPSMRQTRILPAAPPLSLDTEMLASARAASATASPDSYSGGAPAHDAAHAPRAASARYLTVSAVLSRSGVAHVVRADEGAEDVLRLPSGSSKSRRVSNGGALEAVGALLLSRGDSLGAASNLSSQRPSGAGARVRKEAPSRPNLLARASRAWMQGLKEVGAARFGIAMPELSGASPGGTIAERRALRAQAEANGVAVVGGRRNQPSFEVPRPPKSTSPARTPLRRAHSAGAPSTLPPASSSVYGRGSAWGVQEAPEAPPSPIGMPGAWSGGATGWSSRSGEGHEDGALLLPPPLLDDHSSARSFEGLLGVRRMREREKELRRVQKQFERNRPLHKVGMLTALSNFVKAAHAADQATKALARTGRRGAPEFRRRHTEPAQDVPLKTPSAREAPPAGSVDMARKPSLRKGSIDLSRSLETVYEGGVLHAGAAGDSDLFDDESSFPLSDRHSRGSSGSSLDGGAPRAPRLLPVHLSVPGSPFTPMALDTRPSSRRASLVSSPESHPHSPDTPRLGPTLLSLPPSPWTPHASYAGGAQYQFALAMTAAAYAQPGTPRLQPTHLEIMPSPLPTPMSSRPWTPVIRSPPSLATTPSRLSPSSSPVLSGLRVRKRVAKSNDSLDDVDFRSRTSSARLTPSAMLVSATHAGDTATPPAAPRILPDSVPHQKPRRQSLHAEPAADVKQSGQAAKPGRNWLLWFLLGDLGLGASQSLMRHGAVAAGVVHFCGFIVFTLAHAIDLGFRIGEVVVMTLWFLRWLVLNVTGQTILSRCVIDAYGLIKSEWAMVALEDHENRGKKLRKGEEQARGLSRWETVRSLVELVCLYSVTRQRYLDEGAGLQRLDPPRGKHGASRSASNGSNANVDGRREEHEDAGDDSDSDDDLVVTRQGADVLEFSKTPRLEPRLAHGERSRSGSDSYFAAPGAARTPAADTSTSHSAAPSGLDRRALIRTIKWASRLAISAYGLHVTLVDLPATFTPSGNRFSRQTFAHLSRIRSDDVLHADIQTLDSDTYHPTFYLVRDYARRCVCVSVRGTQSLQDIIVDLEFNTSKMELSPLPGEDATSDELTCHAGVLRAAKTLVSKDSTLFSILSQALAENEGFDLVLTGHSLGGAIASTVALLLSEYRVPPGAAHTQGDWITRDDTGLPAGRGIRAITFAHPAAVSAALAERATLGAVPLVTSVVLGSDIIPRCGHGQARELRRLLGALSRVRRRHARRHQGDEEDARVHIVRSWWDWMRTQRAGAAVEPARARKARRTEDQLWRLRCEVENDLYAAIKLRSSDSPRDEGGDSRSAVPPSPWVGPQQRASAPLHQLAARRHALDAATLRSEAALGGILIPPGRSIWINGTDLYLITAPLAFYSTPDLSLSCLDMHLPSRYEEFIDELA